MDIAELHVVTSTPPSASINSARISNDLDDSFAFEDSMMDEPLFLETNDASAPLSLEESKLHSIAMPTVTPSQPCVFSLCQTPRHEQPPEAQVI